MFCHLSIRSLNSLHLKVFVKGINCCIFFNSAKVGGHLAVPFLIGHDVELTNL